ncbi:MAG TPA: ATP-grasp domain-containing protein [Ktedonobacteraceae bacterium]|jgi:ribosomal protein S6--L-glutamate ligase|nr:ATP-grasp domain-containing protein [Ktedonobacteraceae bacterium]
MHFCFIIEEQYRDETMPMGIVDQLRQWGHSVDLLEPGATIVRLGDLAKQQYDAYVLKTVSDGPGLSILEAAEAIGVPTINHSRSIRLVRDKAVAAAYAQARGLPVPLTYFAAHEHLLEQVPAEDYPLVVKPANGSSGRGIYRVNNQAELQTIEFTEARGSFLLAQHYIENTGFDIKLYVAGKEVYPVAKSSPLHPEISVDKHIIPITLELRNLALRVGTVFGLDIYGLDIVETADGLSIVDINDFPSFGLVPRAVARIANHIIRLAKRAEVQRASAPSIAVTVQRNHNRITHASTARLTAARAPILQEEMQPFR